MLGPDDLVFNSFPVAHVPLLDRLGPVRAAGFTGISIGVADWFALTGAGMKPAEIRARIADAGLQVAEIESVCNWLRNHGEGTSPSAASLAPLTADLVIGIAAELGARSVLVIEMSGVKVDPDSAAEDFANVCDKAADHGLIAHLECLLFGGIPDLAAAWRIVSAAGRDNSALTIDAWHLYRGGSTLAELAAIPAQHIGTVQLCDAPLQAQGDPLTETMTARLLPGEGELDVEGMVRTIDALGSRAPIGVEVFNSRQAAQPIAAVAQAWAVSARAMLAKARS